MHLSLYERAARVVLGGGLLVASFAFAWGPAAQIVSLLLAGYFIIVEAVLGRCPLLQAIGVRDDRQISDEQRFLVGLVAIQGLLAYTWFMAGWEKMNDKFVTGMAGTLTAFAGKNPLPWVRSFLMHTALPNAALFAELVRWGELAVGVGLLIGTILYITKRQLPGMYLVILSLVGGAFLNLVFYLSAGWMSASTHGMNVFMFWVEAILVYMWKGRLVRRYKM